MRQALVLICLLCTFALAKSVVDVDWQASPRIVSVRFLLADDELPPPDAREWSRVMLPDNWSKTRREAQGIAWYRVEFELPGGPEQPLAIMVRRLSMNAEWYVNGNRLLSGGRMTSPVTRNWNVPLFVEVPPALLTPGRNILDVRLFAYRNSNGGLGTVYLGDPAELRDRHAYLYALHVKGAIVSFSIALLAAFLAIVGWLRMGRDPVYGLFGLAMIAWVVRYANYFVQDVPFDPTIYATVVNSAQGWFFIFFANFLLRLTRLHWPYFERALYTAGALGTVFIYAAFQGWIPLWLVTAVWMVVWLPSSLTLLAVSSRHAYRSRSVIALLATLVAWLYVPLTARELIITSTLGSFDSSYVAHYVGILLVVLIAWMLIDRAVDMGRVASRAEVARAHAAFDERLRMTQDMHDGLGLQLNAALRMAERGQLRKEEMIDSLQACLGELRLIVDSSASDAGEFLPLLASLRYRLQPKLTAIGLQVNWQLERFPSDLSLPPGATLQVLRIVQEVINNVIKHSRATTLTFRVGDPPAHDIVRLLISDNGVGFTSDTPSAGRGVAGMQRRAASVSIPLRIIVSDEGTTVQIDLPASPIPHPAPPADVPAPSTVADVPAPVNLIVDPGKTT